MNDQQLEQALKRRTMLVPDGATAAARAMATLELDVATEEAELLVVRRNPWTIPVVVLPVLLSGLVLFVREKEVVLDFAAKLGDGLPRLLQMSASSWQQVLTGVAPGVWVTLGATVLVGCLFASWSVGAKFVRQVRVTNTASSAY